MRRVEQHIIKRSDDRYNELDASAFSSKNLYNATLYRIRQHFFETKKLLQYKKLQKEFQNEGQADYRSLPTKVSQWTMKMAEQNFRSFLSALREWKKDPSRFLAKPKMPKYLDRDKGRFLLTYTSQAIGKRLLEKNGLIKLSGTNLVIATQIKYSQIQMVRVVKRLDTYVVEVVYDNGKTFSQTGEEGCFAAIDLGVSNLATVTSNKKGFTPFVIDGRYVKSINQRYNKRKAHLKSIAERRNKVKTTKALRRMEMKRSNRMKDYMHKASRVLVNQLVENGVSRLVVGHNTGWKQDTGMGSVNNQNFVSIPFCQFIQMLRYKCESAGISFSEVNESHTSKCSFLDMEEICHHDKYVGRRIKRGLFRSSDGSLINADVNGSYNILRRAFGDVFSEVGVKDVIRHPRVWRISNPKGKPKVYS